MYRKHLPTRGCTVFFGHLPFVQLQLLRLLVGQRSFDDDKPIRLDIEIISKAQPERIRDVLPLWVEIGDHDNDQFFASADLENGALATYTFSAVTGLSAGPGAWIYGPRGTLHFEPVPGGDIEEDMAAGRRPTARE